MIKYCIILFFILSICIYFIFFTKIVTTDYIRVYLSSYMFENDECKKRWEHLLNPELPIRFTYIIDDCDIIFIVNGPNEEDEEYINQNPKKCIITFMESYLGKKPSDNKYLSVWDFHSEPNNFEWYFPMEFNNVKKQVFKESKIHGNTISIIVSSLYELEGHKKRIDFIKYLEDNYSDKIKLHIYGKDNAHNFKNYIGPLVNNDKSNALIPYKYHFNCENTFVDGYITEKFTDGILCENYIFYGGPKNVHDFYNKECYTLLDMNDFETSANLIIKIIENNEWNKKIHSIRKLKQYILDTKTLSVRILNELSNNV